MKPRTAKDRTALAKIFAQQIAVLATSLQPATVRGYRGTARNFLRYRRAQYPQITKLSQLRRDPHIYGWLRSLCAHQPPWAKCYRLAHIIHLRRLLEMAAFGEDPPAPGLILSEDLPRLDQCLPRALPAEEDQRLVQQLRQRNDLLSNALLLMRGTGMRIGECLDLPRDCVQAAGEQRWAIHVPLGKLHTERWVPIDDEVREVVNRLLVLRTLVAPPASLADDFLLPRPKGREVLAEALRASLRQAAQAAGLTRKVVPHQLRHDYATEMLRAGVSLPSLMKLLGHTTPRMTLRYLDITQVDLQREFYLARQHPRHSMPVPPPAPVALGQKADVSGILQSLGATRYLLEMYRRQFSEGPLQRRIGRWGHRLVMLAAEVEKLTKE
jgi:site-specific recombinase XerD